MRSRITERVARHGPPNNDNHISIGRSSSGSRSSAVANHTRQGAFAAAASAATIDSLLRNQTRLSAPLNMADWKAVVSHVYTSSATPDAQFVAFLIKDAVLKRERGGRDSGAGADGGKRRERMERSAVPFGVFMQVLLGYQLHRHLRRLRFFKEDFREVTYSSMSDNTMREIYLLDVRCARDACDECCAVLSTLTLTQ